MINQTSSYQIVHSIPMNNDEALSLLKDFSSNREMLESDDIKHFVSITLSCLSKNFEQKFDFSKDINHNEEFDYKNLLNFDGNDMNTNNPEDNENNQDNDENTGKNPSDD